MVIPRIEDVPPEQRAAADRNADAAINRIETVAAQVAHDYGGGAAVGGCVSAIASGLAYIVHTEKPGRFAGEDEWVAYRAEVATKVMALVDGFLQTEEIPGLPTYCDPANERT